MLAVVSDRLDAAPEERDFEIRLCEDFARGQLEVRIVVVGQTLGHRLSWLRARDTDTRRYQVLPARSDQRTILLCTEEVVH